MQNRQKSKKTAILSKASNTLHSLHQSFNSLCISKVLVQCVQWRLHPHCTKWVLIICMLGYRCNECNVFFVLPKTHTEASAFASVCMRRCSRKCEPLLHEAFLVETAFKCLTSLNALSDYLDKVSRLLINTTVCLVGDKSLDYALKNELSWQKFRV